jgi:hypothetical protein
MKLNHALIDAFDRAMLNLYHEAKRRLGYNASYFRRMVSEYGGLQAAKMLLAKPMASSGFTELFIRGAVELTVEALVTQSRWRSLFSAEELAIADSRLQAVTAQAA